MKRSPIVAVVVVVIALVLLYLCTFTIHESEQAVIKQFSKVIATKTEPGLHFKAPWWTVQTFEKRWLEWDGDANQITTLDKRYIYIDVFARWRISDLGVFFETLRDERSAQSRLDDIIDNATRNVVANHNLIEAIRTTSRAFSDREEESLIAGLLAGGEPDDGSSQGGQLAALIAEQEAEAAALEAGEADAGVADEEDADAGVKPEQPKAEPSAAEAVAAEKPAESRSSTQTSGVYAVESGRQQLTRLILEKASEKAMSLGIEIKDVQIKRIDYIESVQAKVFERMISERKRVAEAFRSQGQGLSAKILGKMEKELKKIRSEAYRRSQEVKGQADAEAAAVYARAYEVDPELYGFLKTMDSYKVTVDEDSWLLLTTDADYAHYLSDIDGARR